MEYAALAVFFSLFALIAGLILAALIYNVDGIARHGGVTGHVLGGRIEQTSAEFILPQRGLLKGKVRIHEVRMPDGNVAVGVEVVRTSLLSYNMTAFTLDLTQADAVAALLSQMVARHRSGAL